MTTASPPQSKLPKFQMPPRWLTVTVAALLIIAVMATLLNQGTFFQTSDPLQGNTIVAVEQGPLVVRINATGEIEPRVTANLSFNRTIGQVKDVLVTEGDRVEAGDTLVTLQTRQLQADVSAAQASLAEAQADLQALQDGATPEEIAAARAQITSAQGSLTQTQGSVTAADINSAQASITEARIRIAELEAGAERAEIVRAETELAQAKAALDRQRSTLATDKEQVRRTVDQRANELRDAQTAYSTAFWDREFVDDNGQDPRIVADIGLTDAQKQDFSTAFEQATLDLENAEIALAQAQADYENAKNLEVTGLADAEARIRSAQADLDELFAGADADELAAARAQLAQAEADLASLQGSERQGAIVSQQGNVANAQAQLDQLLADPTQSELARSEARVAQAEAQLVRAEADLDDATLRAPFAGVVGRIDVAPGETLGQDSIITLLDVERYQVILNVDEVDVARVATGQPVEVLIDALGAPTLEGIVRNITPLASDDQAVTAYEVTVEIDPANQPVKPGMTASATIEVARQDNALSVPVQAIFTEEGETVVRVVTNADGDAPQITIQPVKTGLRAGDHQQILDGLDEGQQVLIISNDV